MRYTNIGDEVSVPATLVQASVALDVAGRFAQETKNFDGMLRVAEAWLKVTDLMAALEEAEEKREKDKPKDKKVPLGFQPSDKDEDNEIEEEDAGSDSGQRDDPED